MTVKELKKSLGRLSSDFDDTIVAMQFLGKDGQFDVDALAFTGYTKDFAAVILGSHKAALELQKKGKIPPENAEEKKS